jgi:glycosyltransferase involved in cell wall biosynthesis
MFSVVIPLFNKAPYLQRALDSIYAQAFPPREIIVVNDGSTDGGERIAKAQSDPRLIVIDQPNRGVSAARNAGIKVATQPFIAFLDADDRWMPGYLVHMKDVIEAHPGASMYGAGYRTFEHGRCTGDFRVRASAPGLVDFFHEWSRGHLLHMCTTVVPKAVLQAVGGFGEHVAYGDDYFLWAKLALNGPVVLSPECMSEYNISVPGQIIEYYRTEHTKRFEVFEYQRLLATKLHEQVARGGIDKSLVQFCRKDFGRGLLQRLYWGNFSALQAFCDELQLRRLPLGAVVQACCWAGRQRFLRPSLRTGVATVRGIREFFIRRRGR